MKNIDSEYIDFDTLIKLDLEWSDFLTTIPEQLGYTIADGNAIFAHKVKRHLVKMSLKYDVSLTALKNRYGNEKV